MAKELWQSNATKRGEECAREHEFTELPVDPFEIADRNEILVEPLPSNNKSVSGRLVYANTQFGIQYATYLNNEGFERFSVAHELGHYFTPGHPEKLLINGVHNSRGGFVSGEQCELEADHFAAGLLMPAYLFDKELNNHLSGLSAVEALAGKCETSLTATAIRYAQRTPDAIAIIISEKKVIDYCFMSDELKQINGLRWIKKGTPVPQDTVTYRFNSSDKNILNANKVDGEASIEDWFDSRLSYEMYEEVIGLGGYGKTLTVLSIDEFPDQEEIDEEDDLVESWTPRFKR